MGVAAADISGGSLKENVGKIIVVCDLLGKKAKLTPLLPKICRLEESEL